MRGSAIDAVDKRLTGEAKQEGLVPGTLPVSVGSLIACRLHNLPARLLALTLWGPQLAPSEA